MALKASNLVAIFGAVAIGAALVFAFQCSGKQSIQDTLEKSRQNHNARLECAINPDTCKPAP